MGSREFQKSIIASSAGEAYRILCEEAERYSGHCDGYSGDINSTDSKGRCVFYDKYNKTNLTKGSKIITSHLENMDKRECAYIELSGVQYKIVTVKKNILKNKEKPKYKKVFNVYAARRYRSGGILHCDDFKVVSKKNKTEAWDYAVEKSLETGKEFIIKEENELVKGDDCIGSVVIETKEYKTKPKRKLKDNEKLTEYNQFIFFGYAPE